MDHALWDRGSSKTLLCGVVTAGPLLEIRFVIVDVSSLRMISTMTIPLAPVRILERRGPTESDYLQNYI